MPKRSSDKEQEVLGQIFDFIFKEAKKKPEKRKPIKLSGLNGKSMLTDGLVAALERPGVFLTEQSIKDFSDALDVSLFKLQPDEISPISVKVAASSLVDIFKDPIGVMGKTIDKTKAARKEARSAFMRTTMREFIANGWARKYADLDTQQAVRLGLVAQNLTPKEEKNVLDKDRWNMQAALSMSAGGREGIDAASLSYMQERAGTLIGRRMFTERGWNSLSNEDREKYGKIFASAGSGELKDDIQNQLKSSLVAQYGSQQGMAILDRYNRIQPKNKPLSDPEFYRALELSNLDSRINTLKSGVKGLSQSEIDNQISTLDKAKILIAAQDLDSGKIQLANMKLRNWVQQTKNEIRLERDPDRKKELKAKLKELRSDSRQLNSMAFFGKVGEIEGIWGSMQNFAQGGLAPSILNGDFFDKNKNNLFRPSDSGKSILGVGFVKPIEDKNNKLINGYNAAATQIYYLTPRSVIRTLFFNGEGFAYLMYRNRNKLENIIKKNGLTALDDDFLKSLLGKDSEKAIGLLLAKSPEGVRKELGATLRNFSRNGKFHKFFSYNSRIKDQLTGFVNKIRVKYRARLVKTFMKSAWFRKAFSGASGKLLGQWIAKGSIQSMARALVVGLANVLGFATTGGAANVVITMVAVVVTDVMLEIAKVLFGIVIFALIGLVGLFVIGGIGVSDFAKKTFTYANTVPGMVVTNPNYKGTSEIVDPNDPVGPMDPFIGGVLPDGEKCLLGTGSFHCSQGPYGSYSHQNVAAIDVSSGAEYFYAPAFCGDNNCTVTYSGSTSCTAGYAGGMMIFSATYGGNTYQFTLIHVNPKYGVGAKLSSGERVARVMTLAETTNACSSGKHIHIQARMNGAIVNPRDVLNNSTSSGGFACNISECDK